MIAQYLVHFLFTGALVTAFLYFKSHYGSPHLAPVARGMFRMVALGIIVCFGLVVYNVMTSDFQYFYVYNYSSRELPTPFLFAASYAGQEGSFLLWTMWTGVIGLALIPYLKRNKWEPAVMACYSVILVFLLLMLVVKNPFSFVWETFAKDGVPEGFTPVNGRGLNPLLHNIWITIHPPILFTGFATMAVPYALAFGALLQRRYKEWVTIALPWTLAGTAILGFGIMLGGFWAYETLGWGGFWGWDPVENSSLIPWIAGIALVHTMVVQQRTGGFIKTNIVLAFVTFVLVLYSTFLTRSGVLGDTSVHSFVDPGFFAFLLLIIFMGTFILGGIFLLFRRLGDLTDEKARQFKPVSREFGLGVGSALLLASALLVFLGTSWPLIAEIIGKPKVAVDIAFYNNTHIPLVVGILLVNVLSLLMRWKVSNFRDVAKKGFIGLMAAVVLTAGSYALGVHKPEFLVLTFFAWFALVINVELAFKVITKKFVQTGAYFSHMGIAMLVLGVIATAGYTHTEHVVLPQNTPVKALGEYTLTFMGKQRVETEFTDREKYEYTIKVEQGGKESIAKPILFWSDFNKRQSAFLEPGISWSLLNDVYVSPKALETVGGIPTYVMRKGDVKPVPMDSSITASIVRFDMSEAQQEGTDTLNLATVIRLASATDTSEHTIVTRLDPQTMNSVAVPYTVLGTNLELHFMRLTPNKEELAKSEAIIGFRDLSKPIPQEVEVFTVEASLKPFINLVWIGVITMVAGFFISIFRYRRKKDGSAKAVAERQTEGVEVSG